MQQTPEECLATMLEEHHVLHYLGMLLLFCPS